MISLHVDKLKTGWPTHGRQSKEWVARANDAQSRLTPLPQRLLLILYGAVQQLNKPLRIISHAVVVEFDPVGPGAA